MNSLSGFLLLILLTLLLHGCSTAPVERDGPPSRSLSDAEIERIPEPEPRTEILNPANLKPYTILGKTYHPMNSNIGFVERGTASWYGDKFHGRRTANGETYNMYAMTAAHTRLPLPSYARVKNLQNGRSVVVKVNDRGPFHGNRIIDLSYVAARKLGFARRGTAQVEVQAITPGIPLAQPEPSHKRPARQIYLQIAAFHNQVNAQNKQRKIQGTTKHPVQIETSQTDLGTLHRVQAGPLPSIQAADQLADELKQQQGIQQTQITIR